MDIVKNVRSSKIVRFILLSEVIVVLEKSQTKSYQFRIFDTQLKEIYKQDQIEGAIKSGRDQILVHAQDSNYYFLRISDKGQINSSLPIHLNFSLQLSNALTIGGQHSRQRQFLVFQNKQFQLFCQDLVEVKTVKPPNKTYGIKLKAYDSLTHEVYAWASDGFAILSADSLSIRTICQNHKFLGFGWSGTYFSYFEGQDHADIVLADRKTHRILWRQEDFEDQNYPVLTIQNENSERFVIVSRSTTLKFTDLHEGALCKFDTSDEIQDLSFWLNQKYLVYNSLDILYLMNVQKYMQRTRNSHQKLNMQEEEYPQYAAM